MVIEAHDMAQSNIESAYRRLSQRSYAKILSCGSDASPPWSVAEVEVEVARPPRTPLERRSAGRRPAHGTATENARTIRFLSYLANVLLIQGVSFRAFLFF